MKHSFPTYLRACVGFAGLHAAIAALLLGTSVFGYSQDEQPSAISVPPILKRHIVLPAPASALSGPNRSSVKPKLRVAAGAQAVPVNAGTGVVYTCASNVAASTCNYLNTVIAGYYNSVFTNANANIYIQYGNTGLGQSVGYYNLVHYSSYVTALNAITNKSFMQTSALSAINTYATPIYGTQDILEISVALGATLGFSGLKGITSTTAACTPYTASCYNEIITVANAASQAAGGYSLYYDDQGGTEAADQYDFYAVVQHETDEVLGTTSCISTGSGSLVDGCDGPAPAGSHGVPSAPDLDRYKNPGVLASNMAASTTAGQYFSYDGGTHYGAYGFANTPKVYNTLANGDDFGDYVSSSPDCGTNRAIQDAEGCPGEDAGMTVLNDGQSELTILNAIGYKVPEAIITSPTPGSTLSGTSATFKWSAVTGATAYWVYVGTTGVGSSNIFINTASITATSQAVTGLPTAGTVYVRVYSFVNGFWTSIDYIFKGGTSSATITLSPTSVVFPGSITLNTTDATTEPVTVKNTGTASATLTSFALSGTNAGSFSIAANTCGATLAASATCTVTLSFKPLVTGTNSATLTVKDSAGTGTQTASVSGTGAASSGGAIITLSATSLTYVNTIDSVSSPAQTITVKNTGTGSATLTSIALGGTNPTQFRKLTTCGTTLAASASCAIYVALRPSLAQAVSAVLSITDNAAGSPQQVTLSGTGAVAPPIGLSATSLAFPTTTHGTVSLAQLVKITNNGTATVRLNSISIIGTNPTSFTQISTCGTTVAAAGSCTVIVAFSPATAGALSATLNISDNGAASPQTVSLSGTGN